MKILDKIIFVMEKMCGVALLLMTLITFAQAFNRYVLGNSFQWAEELVIMGMIWIAFLGSTVAVRKETHTRIDFLINMFPARIKALIEGFDYLLMAAFCGVLFYVSIDLVKANLAIFSPGLRMPRALLYLAITIGMISMVVYLIALAICKFTGHNPDGGEK